MRSSLKLVVCLVALMCTGGAYAQTPDAQTPDAQAEANMIDGPNTAPIAYVYVSTSNGINLYDAAPNGKPGLVSGSPFHTTLPMIGSNGSYFVTLDYSDYATIHSYKVGSNGAIEGQVSSIDSQDYNGVNCGATDGGVFDHTGEHVYVLLDTSANCGAFQTYSVAKGTGALSFKGANVNNNIGVSGCCTLPAITPKDTFSYVSEQTFECDGCYNTWGAFKIGGNGTFENSTGPITGPKPKSSNLLFTPGLMATDGEDHLAVLGSWYDQNAGQYTDAWGLASYTVNPKTGALTSTNTWKELPSPINTGVGAMRMSPSGKILALAGEYGLQFFHFNGAAPITEFGGLKTKVEIDEIKWDNNNHLYALSNAYNMYSSPNGEAELFVFTVTPTSITEVPGSPFHIAGADGLVVVAK